MEFDHYDFVPLQAEKNHSRSQSSPRRRRRKTKNSSHRVTIWIGITSLASVRPLPSVTDEQGIRTIEQRRQHRLINLNRASLAIATGARAILPAAYPSKAARAE